MNLKTRADYYGADIYKTAFRLLRHSPYKLPVKNLAISCFELSSRNTLQLNLFKDLERSSRLVTAIDTINDRWGNFVITPATIKIAPITFNAGFLFVFPIYFTSFCCYFVNSVSSIIMLSEKSVSKCFNFRIAVTCIDYSSV